jgi:hypothetical protein
MRKLWRSSHSELPRMPQVPQRTPGQENSPRNSVKPLEKSRLRQEVLALRNFSQTPESSCSRRDSVKWTSRLQIPLPQFHQPTLRPNLPSRRTRMEEEVEPEPAGTEESLTEARGNRRKRPTSALLQRARLLSLVPARGPHQWRASRKPRRLPPRPLRPSRLTMRPPKSGSEQTPGRG